MHWAWLVSCRCMCNARAKLTSLTIRSSFAVEKEARGTCAQGKYEYVQSTHTHIYIYTHTYSHTLLLVATHQPSNHPALHRYQITFYLPKNSECYCKKKRRSKKETKWRRKGAETALFLCFITSTIPGIECKTLKMTHKTTHYRAKSPQDKTLISRFWQYVLL